MTELWHIKFRKRKSRNFKKKIGSGEKSVNFQDIVNFFFLWSLMVPFKSTFNNIAQDMSYRSLRSC